LRVVLTMLSPLRQIEGVLAAPLWTVLLLLLLMILVAAEVAAAAASPLAERLLLQLQLRLLQTQAHPTLVLALAQAPWCC
jgi:hypothetical protein